MCMYIGPPDFWSNGISFLFNNYNEVNIEKFIMFDLLGLFQCDKQTKNS